MISGSLPAFSELKPRTRIVGDEPGAPLLDVRVTPGTVPERAVVTFEVCDCDSVSEFTTLAEPVKADFFALPKATTIISSRFFESLFSKIRMLARALT